MIPRSRLVSFTEYVATIARFAWRQLTNGLSNLTDEIRSVRHLPPSGKLLRQCTGDEFTILVDANEAVGRSIYLLGDFENAEAEFLRRNVRPGDICFDVGANIGYFTLLMARLASNGTVHAFEPVPFNQQLLNLNIHLNRFSNASVHRCAVGDVAGSVEFTISEDSAFSSFLDTQRRPVDSRILVDVVTLDGFCDQHLVPRVDCLKVDVEGAEGKVLAGATALLSDPARQPRFIVMEVFGPMLARYEYDVQKIVSQLCEYGYEAYLNRAQLVPLTPKDFDRNENVLFLARQSRGQA